LRRRTAKDTRTLCAAGRGGRKGLAAQRFAMTNLDLAPIGNCGQSALIDRNGRFVWACVPRIDGDPMFCALMSGRDPAEDQAGIWAINLVDQISAEQRSERNPPILVTTLTASKGAAVEITDFCPRYRRHNRLYRPNAFIRVIRSLSGAPRIRVRLKPAI